MQAGKHRNCLANRIVTGVNSFMEEYYRVELYDRRKGSTRGGFVAAALAIIHTKLGVSPDIPDEQG